MSSLITSPHNPRLARVRALLEKRRQRDEEKAFVVEGVRLAEEALSAGWQPEMVLYTDQLAERGQAVVRSFVERGAEAFALPAHLMERIAGTENPQGLLAVLPQHALPLPQRLDFVLIADNLRDPGNLGTLLRSAVAAGVQAVLLSPGATDAFAPKVLRAGMGAHFHLPVLHLSWEEIRALCAGTKRPGAEKAGATAGQFPLHVFLAEAAEGESCWSLDLREPLALVVGSEAEGASREAMALADQTIRIPMPGQSESLNAAVAASILLFEVVRQRAHQ